MTEVDVFLDTEQVGHLSVGDGIRPTVRFQYAPSWLGRPGPFAIDPALPLEAAPFVSGDRLFGAFRDSAPDEWGRGLLSRTARGRRLEEADFLLGVSDETRQGALRYRGTDGQWLTTGSPVPVVLDLPTLRRAARDAETGTHPPLRELAAGGAGTGGARPKVVVKDGDELWLAKFGRRGDDVDVESAEHAIALLSAQAGVSTVSTRLVVSDVEPILMVRRFDRGGPRRIGYLSALSLLEHEVGPERGGLYDYLDLADAMTTWSSRPTVDLRELWRRIAFGTIVRNTDDHMRNHGFVHDGRGWRLSPAFDVNTDVRTWTSFVTAVDGVSDDGRLEALLGAAEYFRLDVAAAREILREVVLAARDFDEVARSALAGQTLDEVTRTVSAGVGLASALLGPRAP